MSIAETAVRPAVSVRRRFWEIDAVRGVVVILMVYFHTMWNLYYFGLSDADVYSAGWQLFARSIGSTFTFLLGLSLCIRRLRAPQGSAGFAEEARRGLLIFGCGMLVTLATYLFTPDAFVIFGILHLQGLAMLLAYPFVRWPPFWSLLVGLALIALGFAIDTVFVDYPWLIPLGIQEYNRGMADYYPILPWFGFALLGVAAGRLFYPAGRRGFVLPEWGELPPLRALGWLGSHSLPIYLIHQPIIIGALFALGLARL
ncbi:MAG: DUF1624 domain-containing protein [Roseiflexaceae bacterium]|nr:DUF1624 domain-containing protein [Roseiflexaceae bacterium]